MEWENRHGAKMDGGHTLRNVSFGKECLNTDRKTKIR